MNKHNLVVTTVFLLLSMSVFVSAQNEDDEDLYIPPPPQPAYIFGEHNPNEVSVESEKEKLELFVLQFKDTPNAKGYVNVYRGLSDYEFDYQRRTVEIQEYLKTLAKDGKINSYDVYARFEGFRQNSSIEMVIQPPGAEKLLALPDVSLFDAKFYDDASLEKGTVQMFGHELLKNLIEACAN